MTSPTASWAEVEKLVLRHTRRFRKNPHYEDILSAARLSAWESMVRGMPPYFRLRHAILDEIRHHDHAYRNRHDQVTRPVLVDYDRLSAPRLRKVLHPYLAEALDQEDWRGKRQQVEMLLARLTEQQAEILRLRLGGLSSRDVAERMGLEPGWVSFQIKTAVARLRALLAGKRPRARGEAPLVRPGARFGALVAVERTQPPRGRRRWRFVCDCGNCAYESSAYSVHRRAYPTCGCKRRSGAAPRV